MYLAGTFSGMFPTGEPIDLGDFDKVRRWVGAARERVEQVGGDFKPTSVLTARTIDVRQAAGHRVYIGADRLIGVAYENFVMFDRLIHGVGFTPHAPYSLLRPVLESSVWAAWLLDPKHSAVRRQRALWLDVQDFRNELAYFKELEASEIAEEARQIHSDRVAAVWPVFENEATEMRLNFNDLKRKKVATTEVLRDLSCLRTDWGPELAAVIAAEWRKQSGFQHGKAWSTVRSSNITREVKIDGGRHITITPDDTSATIAYQIAVFPLISACNLYVRRTTRTD